MTVNQSITNNSAESNTSVQDPACNLKQRYDEAVQPARDRLGRSAVAEVLSPDADKDTLTLFLISFSAWGVGMTQPVEGWIRRAGEACQRLAGLEKTGRTLATHAKAEANHHEMMIADLHVLVDHWNRTNSARLDAAAILNRPFPPGVHTYQQLHESVIAGDGPYRELAIEYEIESMSLRLGPPWLEQSRRVLGAEVADKLTFVKEHVELDVVHTAFNDRQLVSMLELRPDSLAGMAGTGSAALDAFGAFFNDCLVQAKKDREQIRKQRAANN